MKCFANKSIVQWFSLFAILGMIFYFLHVIIGTTLYPGYNWLTQAVSDLTADSAPSRDVALRLTSVYAIFTVAATLMFVVFIIGKVSKGFRLGIYLFAGMQMTSAVGYALFPLSESGLSNSFQDVMHMVVTLIVVLLSIAAMILMGSSAIKNKQHRTFGVVTFVFLGLMLLGSILTGVVPQSYFGVAERISVYAVVVYSAVLSIFIFSFPSE